MIENIIFIEDSSKATMGGGQELSLKIAEILKRNYQILLFDSIKKSIFQERIDPLISDSFPLYSYGKVVGKAKSSFSLGWKEIVVAFFLFPLNFIRIFFYIRKTKVTRSNTKTYSAGKKGLIYSYFLKVAFGIDYIYHAHSMDDRSSFFFKMLQRPYKASQKIICDSDSVKNNIGLPNCVTIYNAISLQADIIPKQVPTNGRFVVASFASLIKLKGIEYLMKCHQYLKNKDIEIWIFGNGEEKEDLKQYETDKVIMKGYVPDIVKLRRDDIHLTVLPSIVAEAGPMVILESFSFATPVITTNLGGQAEFVQDGVTGFQVPIKDPKAIAEKIDYLFENREKYRLFSKNALEYSEQFCMEKNSDKILNAFLEN